MRDLNFQSPYGAYLLIFALLIIAMQLFLFFYRKKQIRAYADPRLLPYLVQSPSQTITFFKIFAWGLIWVLLCLAFMSPEGNVHYLPSNSSKMNRDRNSQEVIFLIDTSGSMNVPDGENEQSRLQTAKAIVKNLMGQLNNTSVALFAFTSTLTPLVPQTLDYLFTRLILRETHINEGEIGGTQFLPILQQLKEHLTNNSFADITTIVLLSDGEDNQVYANHSFSQSALATILQVFSKEKDWNTKIITVGIGTQTPQIIPNVTTVAGQSVASQLQPLLLEKLAQATNGTYYETTKNNVWEISTQIANSIKKNSLKIANNREVIFTNQEEKTSDLYFQVPLGCAILLFIGGLFVSEN